MASLEGYIKRGNSLGYVDSLTSQLQDAVKNLQLEKVQLERNKVLEEQTAWENQRMEESLQNALARKWQSKIEGGRNKLTKVKDEGGKEVWTGVWENTGVPEEGIPPEAYAAYDKYIGVDPKYRLVSKELNEKIRHQKEYERILESTKKEAIEAQKEIYIEKEKEKNEKHKEKLVQEHNERLQRLEEQYQKRLDANEKLYGDDPEHLKYRNDKATISYNKGRNFLAKWANENGLVDSSTMKPYEEVDEITGEPLSKEEQFSPELNQWIKDMSKKHGVSEDEVKLRLNKLPGFASGIGR